MSTERTPLTRREKVTGWVLVVCLVFLFLFVQALWSRARWAAEVEAEANARAAEANAKAEAHANRSAERRYPGPWVEDMIPSLKGMRLVAREIRGCGYMKYRPSATDEGLYYVRCSRDGLTWRDYLVWANINVVQPLENACRESGDDLARAQASGNALVLEQVQEQARKAAVFAYENCL